MSTTLDVVGRLLVRLALWVAGSSRSRTRAVWFANMAWKHVGTKQWRDAAFFADAALKADDTLPDAYRMKGYVQLRTGSPETARRSYMDGLRQAPQDCGLMQALGDLEQEAGDYERAQHWYEQALVIMPHSHELLLRMGNAASANGQLERASSALSIADHIEPHDTQTLAALGYVQRRLGNFEAAGRLLQEVVSRQPSSETAQYDLALSFAALQNWEGASLHARAALSLDPTNKEFANLVAIVEANIRQMHQVENEQNI